MLNNSLSAKTIRRLKQVSLAFFSLSIITLRANAEVIEKEYFNHYFVELLEGQSLRVSLKASSPILRNERVFYGKTEWSVFPNYRYKDYGSLCVVKEVEVQLNIKFILPKLQYTETPNPIIMEQFQVFYDALYQHELGHKDLGVKAANAVEAQMKSLEPYGNCSDLKADLETKIKKTIEEYKRLNRQYDIDTNHGMTQGAVIREIITVE